MEGSEIRFKVDENHRGERVDVFVSSVMEELGRSRIQRIIRGGNLLVDGKRVKCSYRVKDGEVIVINMTEEEPPELIPKPIPLDILYEDPAIIIVNKQPGIVVHPACGHSDDTLVNALIHKYPDLNSPAGQLRPGIVHRLDKGTSGLMVVARTTRSHSALSSQFKARAVRKKYLAVVCGRIGEHSGEIVQSIGRHIKDRKKMAVSSRMGREAKTRWVVIRRFDNYSFLIAFPETGRTHQIRVHLKFLGHPLVGDELYGGRRWRQERDERIRWAVKNLKRPALHSFYLGFEHPEKGEYIEFYSDPPSDIVSLIEAMGGEYRRERLLRTE